MHHTVVFENKNVKTGFTTWYIWRCSLIQRHPTSGIYDFITFILNSLFWLCGKRTKWIEPLKCFPSVRACAECWLRTFSHTNLSHMSYTDFFQVWHACTLKGAYLKYHSPKKKFLENYSGICNDKTINYRSLTLILGSAYLFLSVLFSSLCLSKKHSWDRKRVSLMFAVLCLLRILLWYLHACCLDGIILGVYCLGLFFDKLCTVFAGKDQICVHKATVWSGLLHWTWNRE